MTTPASELASVTVIQPTVPHYRVDFFERLSQHFGPAFRVYASLADLGVLTQHEKRPAWEVLMGPLIDLPGGIQWQAGIMSVPIQQRDCVIVWGAPRALSILPMILRARLAGARLIWWGQYLSPTSRPWRHSLRIMLMRTADALIFYTDDEVMAYRLTKTGAQDRRPICALNNGLNLDPIASFRTLYRAEERQRAALFIGRVTEKSNLGLAIEALAEPGLETFWLHVLGNGTGRPALQARAEELGVAERVVWHDGITDEAVIARVANQVRLFLYPGDVGLSLIHGLAYGLPAVLHSEPSAHMPEIAAFQEDRNGVSFVRNDAGSLARALDQVVDDTARLDRLSAGALATVSSEFNTARMAERCIEMISRLYAGQVRE